MLGGLALSVDSVPEIARACIWPSGRRWDAGSGERKEMRLIGSELPALLVWSESLYGRSTLLLSHYASTTAQVPVPSVYLYNLERASAS